jgi:hypothetical protein
MDFSNSIWDLNKRFTNRTETTEFKESTKCKNDDYKIINNKRARTNDSVLEVIEISDNSQSEALIVTSPFATPIRDRYCQSNLSQSSDKENVDIPETSTQKNKIIAKQIAFEHKLDKIKKEFEKIESPEKNDIFLS